MEAFLKRYILELILGICYVICLMNAWGLWSAEVWPLVSENAEQKEMAQSIDIVEKPKIALTFDDGPSPQATPELLDGLKERGVKVTFFVIGMNAKKYPELVKREYDEGHIVGNHTYHHVEITRVTEAEARKEILDTSVLVEEITGEPTTFMRPPFGAWQREMELDMKVVPVLWTVDPLDWTTKNTDEIVNKVVTKAKENDIILLHDCYESSVQAAFRIIDILQMNGFDFVTVDELLLN